MTLFVAKECGTCERGRDCVCVCVRACVGACEGGKDYCLKNSPIPRHYLVNIIWLELCSI